MKKPDFKSHWLVKYTMLFFLGSLAAYWQIIVHGKSFINIFDGYLLPFNFLLYYGSYLRNILQNAFMHRTFSIPAFELSFGLGGNTFGCLNFYGFGDVLNLLAVFWPAEKMETLYTLLIFVRLYLAGIAFFLFCRHHAGNEHDGILLGTLIYVFSYWTLLASSLHPYFLNPLIYFPLMLLGIDRILERNNPVLFIAACIPALYAAVYFFYMMSVLAFGYAVMRYFFLYGSHGNVKQFALKFLLSLSAYAVAAAAALPVLLPFAQSVLAGNRTGAKISLFWDLLYYIKFPIAFINADAGHWTSMGYSAIGAAAVFLLFFRTKAREKLHQKLAFAGCLLILLLPAGGHILNGFGYATNRWIWGFNLLVCLIVADQAPVIFSLKKKHLFLLAALTVIFALPTFAVRSHGPASYIRMLVLLPAAFLILAFCIAFITDRRICCFAIILSNLFLSAYCHYSSWFFASADQFEKKGASYISKRNSPFRLFDDRGIDAERKYRIDTASSDTSCLWSIRGYEVNTAMLFNRYGTALYYSTNDPHAFSLLKDIRIPVNSDVFYMGLNERSFPEAFLGCRYCIIKAGEEKYLPYDYTEKIASDEQWSVYENKDVLPLVFAYDSWMEKNEYDSLPFQKKQQVLLQSAALDFVPEGYEIKQSPKIAYTDRTLRPVVMGTSSDIAVDGNRYSVEKPGAFIDVACDFCEAGEYYLVLQGLHYETGKYKKSNSSIISSTISISYSNTAKCFEIRAENDQLYSGIHDFVCNCGYIGKAENTMIFRIAFAESGIYALEDFGIVCQPVKEIAGYVAELTQDDIDYRYEGGRIYISCDLNADRIVCVSAPYQKGSYAVMDGKKQKCFCVSNFATGTLVPAGRHEIEICFY